MPEKGLTDDESATMNGASGRYVVCLRYRSELAEGFLARLLTPWAVRPVAARVDLDEAKELLALMDEKRERGTVFGLLDTAKDAWIVYPKPRGFLNRRR